MAEARNVALTAAGLCAMLETQTAAAAPAGLVATTTAAALADAGAAVAAAGTPLAGGLAWSIALAPLKTAAAAVVVAGACVLTVGVSGHQRLARNAVATSVGRTTPLAPLRPACPARRGALLPSSCGLGRPSAARTGGA